MVTFDENLTTVQTQASSGQDRFTFDRVFPPGTKQQEVFEYGVKECVAYVLIP